MKTHIEHLAANRQMSFEKARGGGDKRNLILVSSLISSSLILFLLVGVATLAASANPDDNLYPVKRALESIHETTTFSSLNKAKLETSHAEGRLDEIMSMAREGETEKITELFVDFGQHIEAAQEYMERAAAGGQDTRELAAKITSVRALKDIILIQYADSMPPELEYAVQEAVKNSAYIVMGTGNNISDQHSDLNNVFKQNLLGFSLSARGAYILLPASDLDLPDTNHDQPQPSAFLK